MAILNKNLPVIFRILLGILTFSNGAFAGYSYSSDDVDYDGFIDAIEYKYGGDADYVNHADLVPPHGTPIIIGLTQDVYPNERFPEIENAVAVAAGGGIGANYVLVLKGNGRVESWSSLGRESIESKLFEARDWQGTHPDEWESIITIEVAPFGVFGIDVNRKVHYCAEPWAVNAVESIESANSIATSNESLIAIDTNGEVHTWSNSWTVPGVPELWQNPDLGDEVVQIAAGNKTFWAVSKKGEMIGWGAPDNIALMTYDGPSDPIQRVVAGRNWAAGVVWFKNGEVYSWGNPDGQLQYDNPVMDLETGIGETFAVLNMNRELDSASYSELSNEPPNAPPNWQYIDIAASSTILVGILDGTPLEWAVADQADQSSPIALDDNDWENLLELDLSYLPISSLDGIKKAINLERLEIKGNAIRDLSPLATLYNLHDLIIEDVPVLYIDALMDLPLASLELSKTFFGELVRDTGYSPQRAVEALRNLAELKSRGVNINLDLQSRDDWWQVYDSSLAAIIMFDRSYPESWMLDETGYLQSPTGNKETSIPLPVRGLRGLETAFSLNALELHDSQVTDLSPLENLPHLHEIDLSNNPIVDLSPLLTLPLLHEINLTDTGAAELLDKAPESPVAQEIQRIIDTLERRNVTVVIDSYIDRDDWQLHFSTSLAQLVRKTLGIEEEALRLNDLEHLTQIQVVEELPIIHDLDGLQYAWNLERITFKDQAISDLTPLRYLHKLYEASLYNVSSDAVGNRISDLSPLIGHPTLRYLDLRGTDIFDISPLADMPAIHEVDLSGTFVGELIQFGNQNDNPIRRAVNIERHALEAIDVYTNVYGSNNRRTDWWRVFEPALGHAMAREWGYSQELSLQDLEQMHYLNAENRVIRDLSGIELAYQLESIDLEQNRIIDLSPLTGLVKLDDLNLADNPVTDITPLLPLPVLELIFIDGTFFAELIERDQTPYKSAINKAHDTRNQLESMGVSLIDGGPPRSDWWILFNPALANPVLAQVGANDYELTLSDLENLEILFVSAEDASDLTIDDLAGIQYALNLDSLEIENQRITNLEPLCYLPNLERISLTNSDIDQQHTNRILDLAPLINHPSLRQIDLTNTDVFDVSPLLTISTLDFVEISGTFASELIHSGDEANPIAQQARSDFYSLPISYGGPSRNDWWRIFSPELGDALIEATDEGTGTLTLGAIEALQTLDARDAGITNLDHLSLAYQLQNVQLNGNPILDLEPLFGLHLIEDLSLSELGRRQGHSLDVTPLSSLRNLQTLHLDNNLLLNIEPLLHIPNLEYVSLSDTYVSWNEENPYYWVLKALDNRGVNLDVSDRDDWNLLFDPALSVAIANELGHYSAFSLQDLQNLTSLVADEEGIESLENLQWAKNLTSLSLRNNSITDLSPISSLTKLTELDLGVDTYNFQRGNLFRDISPLGNLWSLQTLNLESCIAVDYSVLKQLPSLLHVHLKDSVIYRHNPIISKLRESGIVVQQGGDPDFTRALAPSLAAAIRHQYGHINAYIDHLDMPNSGITNIAGMGVFHQLETLNLEGNQISDISPLANMPNLREINLNNFHETNYTSKLSDISVLTTLPALERFEAEANAITNIEPLLECPLLQRVWIPDNFLMGDDQDSPDGKIVSILDERGVYVSAHTNRTDWHKIFKDPMLVHHFNGADASRIANETYLAFGPLHDLTGMEKMYQLYDLNLEDSYVQDLTPLSKLAYLRELNLDRNVDTSYRLLVDISPLRNLPNLSGISISNQGVSDISVLETLPFLQFANLQGNYLDLREDSDTSELIEKLQSKVHFSLSNQRGILNQFIDPALERAIRKQLGLGPNQPLDANDWDSLTTLDAEGYGIEDISMLKFATNLTELKLSGNRVTDFSVLQKLKSLQKLELDNNGEDYPAMENQLTNLSELIGKAPLQRLSLVGNSVADVTPLLRMRSLEYLNLDGNPLDLRNDSETLRLLTVLTDRGSTVVFDDRYRAGLNHGILEVINDPIKHGLYTRNQLRGLALGKPLLERELDGKFRLKLNIYESENLMDWSDAQGSYKQNGGQLTWEPDEQVDTVFYQFEAQ